MPSSYSTNSILGFKKYSYCIWTCVHRKFLKYKASDFYLKYCSHLFCLSYDSVWKFKVSKSAKSSNVTMSLGVGGESGGEVIWSGEGSKSAFPKSAKSSTLPWR
jgi:hypothetical protein